MPRPGPIAWVAIVPIDPVVPRRDLFGFHQAARAAALGARYEPATRDGVAGKMWTELPFEFRLK